MSVARWPKFRPKSFKWSGKKELAGRVRGRILPEFYQNWQKRSQRKFSEEVPYFAVLTKTQRQRQNLTAISKDPHAERCIYVFCEIDRSLSQIGQTFFLARKKFWDMATREILGSSKIPSVAR
jgi:hypothetical protein